MGLFSRTPEQQALYDNRKREKEEAKARAAREKAETEFNEGPVGKAREAFTDGQLFYQTSFDLEQVGRNIVNILGHEMNTRIKNIGDPVGATLSSIDKEGWELIEAGYVFRQTRQDSRDKFVASGQQIAITGQTVGIYLFKRKS